MKSFFLALLSVPAALCIAVPNPAASLSNGVWVTNYDTSGNIISGPTLVAPINATTPHTRRDDVVVVARQSLPNPSVTCSTDFINEYDFDCAKNTFINWANSGTFIGPRAKIQAYCNSAQAYFCVYGTRSRAWDYEINEAYNDVNAVCGSNKSGWVYISAYDKSYGRDNAGLAECGF